jgi:hypothetical protein
MYRERRKLHPAHPKNQYFIINDFNSASVKTASPRVKFPSFPVHRLMYIFEVFLFQIFFIHFEEFRVDDL